MTAPQRLAALELTGLTVQEKQDILAYLEKGATLDAARATDAEPVVMDDYMAGYRQAQSDARATLDVELREAARHLLDVWPMPKAREDARMRLRAALEKDR
jgi:hypothetical protein